MRQVMPAGMSLGGAPLPYIYTTIAASQPAYYTKYKMVVANLIRVADNNRTVGGMSTPGWCQTAGLFWFK